ncbi:DUF4124 domain-containing protein [Acinetobacter shaoyimingii]|uniref:DUF4124 domain-containing protein n=1 Tax=Acinetobacter shaoyimingii TaxID=2715164 RepID=A0A6G8RY66_9GAMM|nr:DUF4124 domain-containing protein [Acinetobacter shaoyimingii]
MIHKIFNFKLLVGITVLSVFTLNSTSVVAAEYYKWVDSKGTTHYSKTPPPKSAKKRTTVKTYGYRGDSSTAATPVNNVENQNQPAVVENQNTPTVVEQTPPQVVIPVNPQNVEVSPPQLAEQPVLK